jgi:hypothetical protein
MNLAVADQADTGEVVQLVGGDGEFLGQFAGDADKGVDGFVVAAVRRLEPRRRCERSPRGN